MRADWFAQLVFRHIPFEHAARALLDREPAHVRAAYVIAMPVAVEREHVEIARAVGRADRVAESYNRRWEVPNRRYASLGPVARRSLRAHWRRS